MRNNVWKFENRKYYNNGWCVFSTGFEWKIQNPNGLVYAVCFKQLATAKAFAEKRMK